MNLEQVEVDNSFNPRIGALDQDAVNEYAQHIEALPPMVAFELEGQNRTVLVCGFHRYAAHQLAGAETASFDIRQGTEDEAREYADLDNLRHGIRLTRSEKRLVIRRYLARNSRMSDSVVARACHTTDKTVRSVRREMEATSEIPRHESLVGADGVERPRSISRPPPEPDGPPAGNISSTITGGPDPDHRSDDRAADIAPPPAPTAAQVAPPPPPPPSPAVSRPALVITASVPDDGPVVVSAKRGDVMLGLESGSKYDLGRLAQDMMEEYINQPPDKEWLEESENGNAV
jgi:hypothetical protein